MKPLAPHHRKQLERIVADARDVAEQGARAAVEALAVHHQQPYAHMDEPQLRLRRRLRAHARQLGEPPFDICVRWKPVEQQAVGWAPDIDDGVRLNIRAFMAQDILGGRRGAGILRVKPNIHWKKDKGREARRNKERFPWFWQAGGFTGAHVNDMHLALEENQCARTERKGRSGDLHL